MDIVQMEPGFLTSFTTTRTYSFRQVVAGASMEGITTQTLVRYYHLSVNVHGNVIYRWCGSRTYTTTTVIWTLQRPGILPNYDGFGL